MFIKHPLLVRICLVLRMPEPAPVPSSREWSPDQHTIIHVIGITCDKNSNKKSWDAGRFFTVSAMVTCVYQDKLDYSVAIMTKPPDTLVASNIRVYPHSCLSSVWRGGPVPLHPSRSQVHLSWGFTLFDPWQSFQLVGIWERERGSLTHQQPLPQSLLALFSFFTW